MVEVPGIMGMPWRHVPPLTRLMLMNSLKIILAIACLASLSSCSCCTKKSDECCKPNSGCSNGGKCCSSDKK